MKSTFIPTKKRCVPDKRREFRLFMLLILMLPALFQIQAQDTVKEYEYEVPSGLRQPVEWKIDASDLEPDEFMAVSLIIEGRNAASTFQSGRWMTGNTYVISPHHEGESDNPDRFVSELYFIDKTEIGQRC